MKKLFEMCEKEGYRFIPLVKGGKTPATRGWQRSNYQADDIRVWLKQNLNIGRIDDRTATLDFESYDIARQWFKQWNPRRCLICQTRRGVHLTFNAGGREIRNAVNANGLYDIRAGGNGYCVFPPSAVNGFSYKLVEGWDISDPGKLDVFRDEWLPIKRQIASNSITNVSAYISTILSVEGQNGSKDLLRAVAKCRDGGLSQTEAMITILEWNKTNATPPWSDRELCRAVTRVYEIYG